MNLVERALTLWYHSDTEWKLDGLLWYPNVKAWCDGVAVAFNVDPDRVYAATSALSPGTWWEQNQEDLLKVLLHGADCKVTTYPANHAKALRLLAGSSPALEMHKPTALKTWNFYNNIKTPDDTSFVTIDRHMARIADLSGDKITIGWYRTLRQVVIDATNFVRKYDHMRLVPSQMQAVLWNNLRLKAGLI